MRYILGVGSSNGFQRAVLPKSSARATASFGSQLPSKIFHPYCDYIIATILFIDTFNVAMIMMMMVMIDHLY